MEQEQNQQNLNQQPAGEPVNEPLQSPEQPQPESRQTQRGKLIIIISIVAVLLIAGCVSAYFLWFNEPVEEAKEETKQEEQKPEDTKRQLGVVDKDIKEDDWAISCPEELLRNYEIKKYLSDIIVALELYYDENWPSYPPNLESLAPKYISKIPTDFDGNQLFNYELTADKKEYKILFEVTASTEEGYGTIQCSVAHTYEKDSCNPNKISVCIEEPTELTLVIKSFGQALIAGDLEKALEFVLEREKERSRLEKLDKSGMAEMGQSIKSRKLKHLSDNIADYYIFIEFGNDKIAVPFMMTKDTENNWKVWQF